MTTPALQRPWRSLFDPVQSPLPHLPWAVKTAFSGNPSEMTAVVVSVLLHRLGPPVALLRLQRVIDTAATGSGMATLLQPLLLLAVVLLFNQLAGAFFNLIGDRYWYRMDPVLKELTLKKAASLSLEQFDDPTTHDLIEQATKNHNRRIQQVCWGTLFLVGTLLSAASVMALLAASSLWLALAGCLVAFPVAWAGIRDGRRLHELTRTQSPGRRLTQYLGNLMSRRKNATELRAYQLVPFFLGRWRTSYVRRRSDHLDVRWASVIEGWVSDLVSGALLAGALGGVVYMAASGTVGAGGVVVLIGAVRLLQENMTDAATHFGYLWEQGLPLSELRRFLELPVPRRAPEEGRPFPSPIVGSIQFEGISFRYPGSSADVLSDLSFTVQRGEKIALVGHNGAGRSTLAKLLLGLYTPTAGRITVDGVDLAEIAPASLRANVSCIFQDFMRYDLTLHDNVAVGRLGAALHDTQAATRAAGLDGVADSLPDGLNTQMGRTFGGTEISGGQWQRVALARAFVRNAQILVLDEPTAALDPRAEVEVFTKFADLAKGRTSFLISHRLGSARIADRIIVLEGGRVAEMGSHDQLMSTGGLYSQLFLMQARWYEDSLSGEVL